MKETEKIMTFKEVDGKWLRVDSQDYVPPTLAEVLDSINIVLDDDTQFCRIIRYWADIKETITYRAYDGKITISIWQSNTR